MDLTRWLRAGTAPHPLLVTARRGAALRLAVERYVREQGWTLALAPAEADLLVVCGHPDPDLRDAVECVWPTLPSPRARAEIRDATDVAGELERARARLVDAEAQRADLATATADDAGDGGAEQDKHDMREDAHEMDVGGHQVGGGHDMHMMHGGEVAGLPMADRAPDRDGLALDQLHVVLGPVLPDWPAGLRVRLTLQGDVVQSAEVEVLGQADPGSSPWTGVPRAAALDSLARLLSVCGWDNAARSGRWLRDELLAGAVDDARLRRFARRLRRSRSLRWATDGLGWLDETRGELAGDATRRWRLWLDAVERADDQGETDRGREERTRVALQVLPALVEGQELAAVRVIVASLDPDLDALAQVYLHGAAR